MIHGTFLNFLYDIIWQSNFDSPKILVKQVKSKKENNDGVKKLFLYFQKTYSKYYNYSKNLATKCTDPCCRNSLDIVRYDQT